jgi:hypothetical protein
MGRFHFHVLEGAQLVTDVEGAHLRDALEARQMAIRSARELLADAVRHGKNRIPEAIVVADEQGRTIETVHLATVLPEPLKK